MRVLPVINNISSNMKKTSSGLYHAGKEGYNIGLRKSQIHKDGDITKLTSISKCVARKVAKQTTVDDLPLVAGAIGMLVPIPLASPVLFCVGKVAQIAVKAFRKSH